MSESVTVRWSIHEPGRRAAMSPSGMLIISARRTPVLTSKRVAGKRSSTSSRRQGRSRHSEFPKSSFTGAPRRELDYAAEWVCRTRSYRERQQSLWVASRGSILRAGSPTNPCYEKHDEGDPKNDDQTLKQAPDEIVRFICYSAGS